MLVWCAESTSTQAIPKGPWTPSAQSEQQKRRPVQATGAVPHGSIHFHSIASRRHQTEGRGGQQGRYLASTGAGRGPLSPPVRREHVRKGRPRSGEGRECSPSPLLLGPTPPHLAGTGAKEGARGGVGGGDRRPVRRCRCLSLRLSLSVSPVAAAVGDRPVAAVVEGRRRPRRWGGVCGVCVCVCARFEGETAKC